MSEGDAYDYGLYPKECYPREGIGAKIICWGLKSIPLMGLGLLVGFLIGTSNGKDISAPTKIYERKVEGDSRNYLIIQHKSGIQTPFVESEGGNSFRRLDDVSEYKSEELLKKLTQEPPREQ